MILIRKIYIIAFLLGVFPVGPGQAQDFFLPKDGAAAQKACLAAVDGLGKGDEVWLAAYSFTWKPLVAALEKDAGAGAKIHLLLDKSESLTPTEIKLVAEMRTAGIEALLTTAGPESKSPGEIWHWKAFVVLRADKTVTDWEGSMNFTAAGWLEGNSARVFADKEWADKFVATMKAQREWQLAKDKI